MLLRIVPALAVLIIFAGYALAAHPMFARYDGLHGSVHAVTTLP